MTNAGLLEKAFKLRFGLKLCLLTIAGIAAVTAILYFVTSRSLGSSYGEAIYGIHDLKIRIFPLIFSSVYSIIVLVVVTAAIGIISMLFSHKIAGPMFRIGKNLEIIGSGDLTVNTRFRGNDQLVSLGEDMNQMVRSLNHTVRSCADSLAELERMELELKAVIDRNGTEKEIGTGIEAMRRKVQELKRLTSGLKVRE